MILNCLLAGVGGQGTVLASKLLAQTAIHLGAYAQTNETIGMAQRGGCVSSHVRIGQPGAGPIIPEGEADVLIAFEPAEAVRSLRYLKPDGAAVVNTRAVRPITAALDPSVYRPDDMLEYLQKQVRHLYLVDAYEISAAIGSPKSLNIVMLASAVREGVLPFSAEELIRTIRASLPSKIVETNSQAVLRVVS